MKNVLDTVRAVQQFSHTTLKNKKRENTCNFKQAKSDGRDDDDDGNSFNN